MKIECAKIARNHYKYARNDLGPDNNPYLAQIITPEKAKLGPDNNFTACIYTYIYIYVVESKICPKIALF